jgi:hypothetical protein
LWPVFLWGEGSHELLSAHIGLDEFRAETYNAIYVVVSLPEVENLHEIIDYADVGAATHVNRFAISNKGALRGIQKVPQCLCVFDVVPGCIRGSESVSPAVFTIMLFTRGAIEILVFVVPERPFDCAF